MSRNGLVIDSHHHFWHPARGDYGWLPKDDPILTRWYGPSDLTSDLAAHGIDATVLIQAAPSVEETEYLLGLADATPWIAKVVGWVNFEDPHAYTQLKRLAAHPKFSGVRPMIQDIKDPNWMVRTDIQWAFAALEELGLTFDCLGFTHHIHNFRTILCRYPEMRAVLDHCLKPNVSDSGDYQIWADGMAALAEDTSVFCKLSGLVTEDASCPSAQKLTPYSAHIIDTFGADRIMWGSDWPVCRLRCSYTDWYQITNQLISSRTDTEKSAILGRTAQKFYGIQDI